MNFLLHLHKAPSQVVQVPDGLRELMSDISREVLRSQPKNIEIFIAEFLEALLKTRDHIYVAQKCLESIMNSSVVTVENLRKSGITREQAKASIIVIKKAYVSNLGKVKSPSMSENPLHDLNIMTRLMQECHLTKVQAKKAADIIEIAYKNYYYQESGYDVTHLVANKAVKNTYAAYEKSSPTQEKLEKAAGKIQSSFRGFSVRNGIKYDEAATKIQSKFRSFQAQKKLEKLKFNRNKKIKAAIKIQSNFRGYLGRKHFAQLYKIYKTEDAAASMIQSTFRGFKIRKSLIEQGFKVELQIAPKGSTHDLEQREQAATKIQAIYKGHQARKQLRFNL